MVALHNPREVTAEWQVKAPLEAGGAKDWSFFKAEPDQGVLPPGQKILLKVWPGGGCSLCPAAAGGSALNLKLALRGAQRVPIQQACIPPRPQLCAEGFSMPLAAGRLYAHPCPRDPVRSETARQGHLQQQGTRDHLHGLRVHPQADL